MILKKGFYGYDNYNNKTPNSQKHHNREENVTS